LSSSTVPFFWFFCLFVCSSSIYVVYVTVGDVGGLSFFGYCLFHFKNGRLGQGFCYLSVSRFFCPSFCYASMAFEVHQTYRL
jgi:hypothetical protein